MKHIIFTLIFLPQLLLSDSWINEAQVRLGVQQSIVIDSLYFTSPSPRSVVFANIKGGVGSTTSTYTPNAHDPFAEINVGLGYRSYFQRGIFGAYSYFGRLKTPYHNYFSRVAMGAEFLSDRLGVFFNCYLPLGARSRIVSEKYGLDSISPYFQGHDLFFLKQAKNEVMSTISAEMGVQKNFNGFSGQARGYVHSSTRYSSKRAGGLVELIRPITRNGFITVGLGIDSVYKTQAQVGVIWSFGPSVPDDSCRGGLLRSTQLEEFFWVQPGDKVISNEIVKRDFYFVDNSRMYSGGFQGDGTFETPFINASLANSAIAGVSDATVYFYQGNAPYQDFGTFNLFATQSITGQGGDYLFDDIVVLPGSKATRPNLARTAAQEAANTQLITVTDGSSSLIENIGLTNITGAVATGGSMITNIGSSIDSLVINNLTSTDKASLFFTAGTQTVTLTDNDIYGVDLKTFNASSLTLEVTSNTFRTNTMIAQRFLQPIGASLFIESLNSSSLVTSAITDNVAFNTRLNGSAHLAFGYLSSGTSTNITPNGFIGNSSIGAMAVPTAGAFLFQGVDASRVEIEGCFNNTSTANVFTLQNCDVNIKKAGFTGDAAGLSEANNDTGVAPFAGVNIFNTL